MLSPGGGKKMSKHSVRAGDVAGLLERFSSFTEKARAKIGDTFPIIVIQEAGLDEFWLHRVLVDGPGRMRIRPCPRVQRRAS